MRATSAEEIPSVDPDRDAEGPIGTEGRDRDTKRPGHGLRTAYTRGLRLLSAVRPYLELTKPRISLWLHIAAIASFYLASGSSVDLTGLLIMIAGSATLTSGVFALNHDLERRPDAAMRRTADRPLPSGRLTPRRALAFGIGASLLGLSVLLALVNVLTAVLAFSVLVIYLAVYTPLKLRTPYHTTPGAVAGAMPPLIGWAAATGSIGAPAWVLFGIVFFWQYPHFLSIDMVYREDYARAGMRVLPVVDTSGRSTMLHIVGTTLLLVAVSLFPQFLGINTLLYTLIAGILGAVFCYRSVDAGRRRTRPAARRLLIYTVLYLPVLLLAMVADAIFLA